MWLTEQPQCSTQIIIQKNVADKEQSVLHTAHRHICILCLQYVHIFLSPGRLMMGIRGLKCFFCMEQTRDCRHAADLSTDNNVIDFILFYFFGTFN